MKLLNCWLLFLISVSAGHANEIPTPVASAATSVTVFINGAQVTRSATIALRPGDHHYRLDKLSPYIDAQSIRVKAEGDFIVKSVFYQPNYLDSAHQNKEEQALTNRLDSLHRRIARQQAQREVLEEEEALLLANRTLSGTNERITMTQLAAVADFFRTRLTELKQRQTTLTFAIDDLKNEQQRVAQQQHLSTQQKEPSGEITMTVLAEQAMTASFEISYTVAQAGWYPTYDVRVVDVASPVQLLYQANVHQRTGEDWNKVKLMFSNADPQQTGVQPTVNPWYVDFYQSSVRSRPATTISYANGYASNEVRGRVANQQGEGIPGVNVVVKSSTVGTVTNLDGHYQLALPQNAQVLAFSSIGYRPEEVPIRGSVIDLTLVEDVQQLEEVVAVGYGSTLRGRVAGVDVEKKARKNPVPVASVVQPTTVSFVVDIPYTISSDGENYTVEMQEILIPADYEYFCAPKISPTVFLTARITDWEKHNLIAGEANIFFEDTFVGRSVLDVDQPSDTLTVSLGQDRAISVNRTQVDDFSEKNFLGTSRTERIGYEIALRSNKAQPVTVTVKDQVPVAVNEQIRISVLETSGAEYNEDTGVLTWSLELPPTATERLKLAYEARYPKNKRVVLD